MEKSKLSKAVLALVLSGAAALPIAHQFLGEKEGERYTAYRDSSGIPTICRGHTAGVKMGDVATPEDCDRYADEDEEAANAVVDRLIRVPLTEPQRAAAISFCGYNLGPTKCATSTFLRELNKGNRGKACDAILLWYKDRGRDCNIRSNNCYGQVVRREQERDLCLM